MYMWELRWKLRPFWCKLEIDTCFSPGVKLRFICWRVFMVRVGIEDGAAWKSSEYRRPQATAFIKVDHVNAIF